MLRLVLLRFLEAYFRHRWQWLLPIVVMSAAAVLFVLRTEPVYISQGAIYVQKQSLLASLTAVRDEGFSWVTPAQATANEIRELLQTDAFVRAVIAETDLQAELTGTLSQDGELIGQVRQAVWVQTIGDNLLSIGASHQQATIAHQISAMTIETFLRWKINGAREESLAAQNFFVEQIGTYREALELARGELEAYYREHPEPVRGDRSAIELLEIDELSAAVELAGARLADALAKEENTRLSIAKSESETRQKFLVIDPPLLPERSANSRSSALISGVIFVAGGAALSLVGIAGAALIDASFRFPIDVRHVTQLPVLALIPDTTPRRQRPNKKQARS